MTNYNGWIRMYRSLLEWRWFNDAPTLQVFTYLLLRANFEPSSWRDITLEQGQVLTSVAKISLSTTQSCQSVRTILKRLQTSGEITLKPTNKYTLITINKYATYQDTDKKNLPLPTNKQQSNNNSVTTDKKNKKEKEEKEEKEKINTQGDNKISDFEKLTLWMRYSTPSLLSMQEPLSEGEYTKLREQMGDDYIRSLLLAMHNKNASRYRSCFQTLLNFGRCDFSMKSKKEKQSKMYTYEEVCDMTTKQGYDMAKDFKMHKRNGVNMWQLVGKSASAHSPKNF